MTGIGPVPGPPRPYPLFGRRSRNPAWRVRTIDFEDVKPQGVKLRGLWHGHGIDAQRRIYVAICTGEELRGGLGDVHLFSYDTRTGDRCHHSSLRQALRQLGNLAPNEHWPHRESVAKVHTDISEFEGKLYFATHDFHDSSDPDSRRGAHLLSFDPASGRFVDLSRDLPHGVIAPNEGVIALGVLRSRRQLVAWTYPWGRIVLYDLDTGSARTYAREGGSKGEVARVVITTPGGDVFVAYPDDAPPRTLFRLDRERGILTPTEESLGWGFFEGLAISSRWNAAFLADSNGELYSFDLDSHRLLPLGSLLPRRRQWLGERIAMLRNLTLSEDQTRLFAIPRETERGYARYHLLEYEIATGKRRDLGSLEGELAAGMPTGNGVWDERGGFYLSCYFGTDSEMAQVAGKASGLVRVDVSDRVTWPAE